jgi:hypothetical protein
MIKISKLCFSDKQSENMKWLEKYARRTIKNMLKENINEHVGYRYWISIDKKRNLIYVYDKKKGKRYVFLG